MIPAPRRPDHDNPSSTPAPRIVYSAVVTSAGNNRAGDMFDTHRATVSATPAGVRPVQIGVTR